MNDYMADETEEKVPLNKVSLNSKSAKDWKNNRWIVLITTTLLLTFNCRIYASPHYSTILAGGDKYGWLCGPNDEYQNLREGFSACKLQRSALARLFSIMMCCESIGCIAGGFLFDKTGPRTTVIIGLILTMAGYLFMIFAGPELDTMKAGAVVGGFAVNIVAFPSLILEDYFPGHGTVCAAFSLACQGLGTLVAPIATDLWYRLDLNFYSVWKYYIYGIFLPVSALYIWITPWHRQVLSTPGKRRNTKLEIELHSSSAEEGHKNGAKKSITSTIAEMGASLGNLISAMTSREYILMTFISSFCMMLGTYYMSIIQETADEDTLEFMSKSMPLDAVYGLLLGKLCEILTTPVMMVIQLLSYCLLSFLTLMGPGKIQYFTIQFLIATFSFSATIKYTYVQETFAASLTGALIGICGTVGGLIGLIVPQSAENTGTISLSFAAASLASVPVPLYLWYKAAIREKEKLE